MIDPCGPSVADEDEESVVLVWCVVVPFFDTVQRFRVGHVIHVDDHLTIFEKHTDDGAKLRMS